MHWLFAVLHEMRIWQWSKNTFVYAALLFSGNLFNYEKLFLATLTFLSFCFISSGIYLYNDIIDLELDRQNAEKKKFFYCFNVHVIFWNRLSFHTSIV